MYSSNNSSKFKLDNWKVSIDKNDRRILVEAENLLDCSLYTKEIYNEDITPLSFKLIDNLNELYHSLIAGADSFQGMTKLTISNEGILTICQKVMQGTNEKIYKSEIALGKSEITERKIIERQGLKIKELEEEIRVLKSNGKDEAQMSKLKAEIECLRNNLERILAQLELSQKRTMVLESELARLNMVLEEKSHAVLELQKRLMESENRINQENCQIKNLEEVVVERTKINECLKFDLQDMKEVVAELEARLTISQKLIAELNQRIHEQEERALASTNKTY